MFRTRLRAPSAATAIAFIALFVALSGTAVAVAPTVVNIADPTTPTRIAKVGPGGGLNVTGATSMLAPGKPLNFTSISFTDGFITTQILPTSATIAVTGIRIANVTSNATNIYFQQYASDGGCDATLGNRFLGIFAVPAGQTVEEQLTTPIVLKPLAGHAEWCLASYASGNTGNGFDTTFNGYTISGTFVSPSIKKASPRGVQRRAAP
jgi:hypothetical protein